MEERNLDFLTAAFSKQRVKIIRLLSSIETEMFLNNEENNGFSPSFLAHELDMTYTNLTIDLKILEKNGFVESEREGRAVNYKLTELGLVTGTFINKARQMANPEVEDLGF